MEKFERVDDRKMRISSDIPLVKDVDVPTLLVYLENIKAQRAVMQTKIDVVNDEISSIKKLLKEAKKLSFPSVKEVVLDE